MTYKEALAFIADAAKYKISLGLDSERALLEKLGNPQLKLKCIQIAGTNGKGSVLSYLNAILSEAGYKVGCYISPSVITYREKMQINGEMIEEQEFADVVELVKSASDQMVQEGNVHPTQFELETAAAFLYFSLQKCDICILETGMGGRLDATNVIDHSLIGIITSISMDHMKFLGNSIEEIASEKAGIINSNMDVIYLYQNERVNQIIEECAIKKGDSSFNIIEDDIKVLSESYRGQIFHYKNYKDLAIQMAGTVQPLNAALAIEAIDALNRKGFEINEQAVRAGLNKVHWPGRFDVITENPIIIVDGAHNPDAAMRLRESLEHYFPNKKIIGIMGVFQDKDYEKIVEIMDPVLKKCYTVTPPDVNRGLEAEELKNCMLLKGIDAEAIKTLSNAYEKARDYANQQDVIVVFGTLSYIGELMQLVKEREEFQDEPKIDSSK